MESKQVVKDISQHSHGSHLVSKAKSEHETTSTTDSAISMHFDSSSGDCGYKSSDLSLAMTRSNKASDVISPSKQESNLSKSEQSITFDSGLGTDCFSPVTPEVEVDLSSKTFFSTFDKPPKQKPPLKFCWKDAFSQDKDGDTVLHLAVVEALSDVIFPLIRLAPHPDFLDITNDLYQTPLHLATLTGKPNIVRRLIVAGATVDIQDRNGNTALHIASRNGDLDCLQAILEPILPQEVKEAKSLYQVYLQSQSLSHIINMKNFEGQTCVHLAAAGGFKKVLEHLYDHGANVNDKDGKSGKTALHYGIESVNYDLVHLLLIKCHANPSIKNYAGKNSLHIAWILSKRKPPKTLPRAFQDLLTTTCGHFEPSSDSETYSSSDENEFEEILRQRQ